MQVEQLAGLFVEDSLAVMCVADLVRGVEVFRPVDRETRVAQRHEPVRNKLVVVDGEIQRAIRDAGMRTERDVEDSVTCAFTLMPTAPTLKFLSIGTRTARSTPALPFVPATSIPNRVG